MKNLKPSLLSTALVATAASFFAITSFAQQTPPEPLLPEVAQIVAVPEPLDINTLKQDVYIGLLAINAPEGIDYMHAGAQATYANQARLRQALTTKDAELLNSKSAVSSEYFEGKKPLELDMSVDGKPYRFPCMDLQNHDCVAQILRSDQDAITSLLNKNVALIKRYLEVTQLPYYSKNSYYYSYADVLPSYQYVTQSSFLRLGEALIALNSGEADQAFTIFQQERNFVQRMLEDDKTLIGKMIAIRMLYTQFNTLNQLLDTPMMQAHLNNPRLQALFSPLSEKAQRGLAQALEVERDTGAYLFYTFDLAQIAELEKSDPLFAQFKDLENWGYNKNKTLNTEYLSWQPFIEAAKLTPEEAYQKYVINGEISAKEASENQLNEMLHTTKNDIGATLLDFARPDFQDYLKRFYDVQVYMALVNLKYEIVRANVDVNEIESFLAKAGNIAMNPYTQKPFEWDAQHARLSAPWIHLHTPINPNKEENMSVIIKPQRDMPVDAPSLSGESNLLGMANPASLYCEQKGGTLDIVKGSHGQIGMCTFADGTKIEEWELFYRDHPRSETTDEAKG